MVTVKQKSCWSNQKWCLTTRAITRRGVWAENRSEQKTKEDSEGKERRAGKEGGETVAMGDGTREGRGQR